MRLRLLKKFVMFMDMIQYQYVWHKIGSSVFNLEILMLKMHRSDRPITGKVDEIMEKPRHISGHI